MIDRIYIMFFRFFLLVVYIIHSKQNIQTHPVTMIVQSIGFTMTDII